MLQAGDQSPPTHRPILHDAQASQNNQCDKGLDFNILNVVRKSEHYYIIVRIVCDQEGGATPKQNSFKNLTAKFVG
jgi:hypothetical protein